ncbi:MAG TPA: cytochrome c biogenesis protein CcdA [Candidatus Paceibacterota bacterium]|nr:cytochrome c biogenesis protein CcdA [Candidatus Paceibacterota bacterium]
MTPLEPLMLAPAAFLAGVLMFLAPCTLPIVPGYLAFISGSAAPGNGQSKRAGKKVIRNAVAFVLGFSAVFILLGLFAGFFGALLGPWKDTIARAAGLVIILFGLTMLGLLRLPGLGGEHHIRLPKFLSVGHPQSSFFIGALFALGWSPCVGPILGTVLLVASTSSTATAGAVLLAAFSLGLGLPFLLTAVFLESVHETFAHWSGFASVLSKIGGVVLVALGVLMLLGHMGLLIEWGYGLFGSFGYGRLLEHL